jgi:predicted lipoprotein
MTDIVNTLMSLRPGAEWTLDGDTYEGLSWLDENQSKPTKDEINTELERLQAEYDAKEYQRLRAAEYPDIRDQLDMQYHDALNGTTTWQDAVNAVKAKYPKPEGT